MTTVNATTGGQQNNDLTDEVPVQTTALVADVSIGDSYAVAETSSVLEQVTRAKSHAYFNDRPLHTEMNDLLSETLPESGLVQGDYYDNEIGRQLSQTIFDAALLTELTPEKNQQPETFSAVVEERYGAPRPDNQAQVKIDPLGFASVQSIDNVPTFYTNKISKIIKIQYANFIAIQKQLESSDVTDVVAGIYQLAKQIAGNDLDKVNAALDEVIAKAEVLSQKYSSITSIPLQEFSDLFKSVSGLSLNNKPFFVAVAEEYQSLKTEIITQWNSVLYSSGLTAWHEREFLSHGDLPKDLIYTANGNFATVEQNQLYTTLVGSTTPIVVTSSSVALDATAQAQTRTPFGVVENPYPQFIAVPLGVAQKSDGVTAPFNASETVMAYQKILSEEILPASATLSMALGDDLATLTAGDVLFTGLANQSGDDALIIADGDALFANTDPTSLWQIYETQMELIADEKGRAVIEMLGLINSEGVSDLFKALDTDLAIEKLLSNYESLTEKQFAALEISLSQVKDSVRQYLSGVIDLRAVYGFLALIYNNLDHALTFADGDKSAVSAKTFFADIGDMLGGILLMKRSGVLESGSTLTGNLVERYDKLFSLVIGYMSVSADQQDNIFSKNVTSTITAMDEVLVKAEETLALPTDYIESLREWSDYPHFLVESQTKEQIFNGQNAPLSHLMSDVLELRMNPEIFYGLAKTELSNVRDAQALGLWVTDLARRADELEHSVLDYLRPANAETFVNRLRYILLVLKSESEVMTINEQRKKLPIDELISQDVAAWSRQLNSGWPDVSGQSNVFGNDMEFTDRTITPDQNKHVGMTDFEILLQGRSGLSAFDAAHKLMEFIANPIDGYFYNFCLIGVERDEEGRIIDAFRDYQNLNELRLVLADIHKMTAIKLNCCPADDKSRLEDILYITSQVDLALAKVTAKIPPSALWTQIQGDELAGMPYMNYYSTPAQGVIADEASQTVIEARGVLQTTMRYPDPLKGVLMNDYQVSSWVTSNQDAADMTELATVLPELTLMEDLAKSLPPSQKNDFLKPLLNNLGHFDTLYYVGRIYERLSLEPTGENQARREHIKKTITGTLNLVDLEKILAHWNTESDQLWPLDISPAKRAALGGLQIMPTEMVWLAGFIGTTIFTNKLVQEKNWLTDAVYQQELNLTEIDNHVDTMNRAEASEMLKQISLHFAMNEPLLCIPENKTQATGVISKVDEAWASLTQLRQVSHENLEVIARDTNAAKLNESEYIYAVLLISSELFNTPSQDELVRYQTYFSSHGGINIKKVVAIVNRFSSYEKELFYVAHRDLVDNYYVSLAVDTIEHIAGDDAVLAQPLIKFLDNLFVTSSMYTDNTGTVDTELLVSDFDQALADSYPEKNIIDGYLAESILYLLDAIIERLNKSEASGIVQLKNLFETLHRALTVSFNKDDRQEVARFSRYNPHGYELPQFAVPKIGIEEVFTLSKLSALMIQDGEEALADPVLKKNIKAIYDGVFEYFKAPAALYLYETDAGLLCLDDNKLYVIIDKEKIEISFDSWLLSPDGTTARLSEAPLAQEIFFKAYRQMLVNGAPDVSANPSALELQTMYIVVHTELKDQAYASYVAEKSETLNRALADYEAVSIVNKYFPEMMCQAMALKKRNTKVASDYSEESFEMALSEISEELDLAMFNLATPQLAQGEKNYGTP